MSSPQSKPAAKPAAAPVLVNRNLTYRNNWLRFLPAALFSGIFHGALLAMLFLFMSGEARPALEKTKEIPIMADPRVEERKDPFLTEDIDPAAQEFDTDIQFAVERKGDVSVPGMVNPTEAAGILDGDKSNPPTNLPAPGGFGNIGQGGAIEIPGMTGNSSLAGMAGGYGPRGMPLAGTFYGRSGQTREFALRNGGGTGESEAAVTAGLNWLARHQSQDGKWMLDDPRFKDRGSQNDIAGTAFGLLPFLGAGKTHKQSKDNPYDKPIEKALAFLMRKQNRKNGDFGGGMYAHGIATIAMCEAYGLTQDQNLRRSAQMAVNFIMTAQHDGGGWRYSPNQAGDTSVVGWQVMALKSAQMAGLDVQDIVMRKAQRYLDSCVASDEGYGYTGPGSTPTMSAVGLLCRQYLQSWGPKNPRMIAGVKNHIERSPPDAKNMYYSYYATQVMHHFGGEAWDNKKGGGWNPKMREDLLKLQDKSNTGMKGSWSSQGDPHGGAGGRLMQTSLSMLTLEVYYRHLPLYYREAGEAMTGVLKAGEK